MEDVPVEDAGASGVNRKSRLGWGGGAAATDREALEMLRLSLDVEQFPSEPASQVVEKVWLVGLSPPQPQLQPSQLPSLRTLRKAPALSPEAPARPPPPDPLPTSPELPPRPERAKPPWERKYRRFRKPKVERLPMHVYSAAGPMWNPLGANALESAWSKDSGVTSPRLLPEQRHRAFKPAEKAGKAPMGMDSNDLSNLEEEFARSMEEEYQAEVKLEAAIAEMMNPGQPRVITPIRRSHVSSILRNQSTVKAADRYRMVAHGSASCSTPQRLFAEHSTPDSVPPRGGGTLSPPPHRPPPPQPPGLPLKLPPAASLASPPPPPPLRPPLPPPKVISTVPT